MYCRLVNIDENENRKAPPWRTVITKLYQLYEAKDGVICSAYFSWYLFIVLILSFDLVAKNMFDIFFYLLLFVSKYH